MDNNPSNQKSNQQYKKNRPRNTRSRYDNKKQSEDQAVKSINSGNPGNSANRDRFNNRAKSAEGSKNSERTRDNRNKPRSPYKSGGQNNMSANNNSRYNRSRYNGNNEKGRIINSKHIETVEDIRADAERIEKDIEFEIRQIKSVKLGL